MNHPNFASRVLPIVVLSLGFVIPRLLSYFYKPKRAIIIGDVHGCFTELQELLIKCEYDPLKDDLYLVGDLVNKGPDSIKVVEFCRKNNISCVMGNHDYAAVQHYHNKTKLDKYTYLKEISKDCIDWLQNLPKFIKLPEYNTIIVHAGLVPGVPLEKQNLKDMLTMRNLLDDGTATNLITEGVPWASKWRGKEHVVFGHDARRGLQLYEYATGLDTGCCYGGKLTALVLPEREIVSVKAHKMYSKPEGK